MIKKIFSLILILNFSITKVFSADPSKSFDLIPINSNLDFFEYTIYKNLRKYNHYKNQTSVDDQILFQNSSYPLSINFKKKKNLTYESLIEIDNSKIINSSDKKNFYSNTISIDNKFTFDNVLVLESGYKPQ